MSDTLRSVARWTLAMLLLAAVTWWWFDTMERKWVAVPHFSRAASQNRMLAATRLLSRHGYVAGMRGTLAETLLAPIPAGTLIVDESGGMITPGQAKQLLAWVAAGNTLIARPQWSAARDGDDPDQPRQKKSGRSKKRIESDPIGAYLGVTLASQPCQCTPQKGSGAASNEKEQAGKPDPRLASFAFPNAPYALQLDIDSTRLMTAGQARTALWSDPGAEAIRIYDEGKGHIVLLAENYFDNGNLDRYDHAELLLGLVQLNGSRNVSLVQRLDMLPWYQALWASFAPAIGGLGCAVLLLLWIALRRFGPLLPDPEQERRALIEHIDAVGRWLSKLPGGRDILLAAARDATEKTMQRRVPELQRLPAAEQARRVARACGVAEADVMFALHRPASKVPIEFTRQVHTLQTMRNHYER